ncbi:MAG: peptidoglycan bridge formation glycyltransferase FemA/FemB family protein [Candidatus Hydrogenedentales bacterium]
MNPSFMQTSFWARFKERTGWKVYAFPGGKTGGNRAPAMNGKGDGDIVVLVRPLALGFGFAYVPHGPAPIPEVSAPSAYLESLASTIAAAIREKILFLRFDLAWDRDGAAGRILLDAIGKGEGRLRRGTAVQVPDTVLLDIGRPEEEILSGMKPKWRYNIKLSDKKGVEISREGAAALDIFYTLYLETAKRDGIAIHPLSYYENLFATARDTEESAGSLSPKLSVWVARHEGTALASIITLFQGGHATYLYGASSGEKRNLMPAYGLQWKAIQAAKAEGCVDYDFVGIPPDENPHPPMAGLYLFKTGFGGTIVHRVGCVDYPLLPLGYDLFRKAEALRLFWFKKIKKMLKGSARRP